MSARKRVEPLDPDSPAGRAAAEAISQVLAEIQVAIWQRQAVRDAEAALAADTYLTVVEAAALMRVHKQTVYRLIWAGELPVIHIGSGKKRPRLRIRRSGVDQFMVRRERGT